MTTLYERDEKAIAKLQKLRFCPLAVTGGDGSYLIDESGRRILDLSASWGAAGLGHSHPALVAALQKASSNQAGASILSGTSEATVSLAEKLLQKVPGDGDRRVWFGHSGSDANETIARAVVASTGKPRLITFSGAYHGGTAGSMAVSGHSVQAHAEKASGLILLPYPDPYRPYKDDPSGNAILAELAHRFETDCPADEIAAIFIEPIQSDGGMIVPPDGFMNRLADMCQSRGILVVCDEVKVGLGRTGRLHCYEHDGFKPDIVTLGKGLGGGLPLSAAIGPASVFDFATSFSMQTLHGNPICTTVGHAVLDTIEKDGLVENARKVGDALQQGLRTLMQKHDLIGNVRGRGLAIGVELVTSRQTREPAAKEAAKLVYRSFELGLIAYYVGMNSNVIEMTPPLTLTMTEVEEALSIMDRAIDDVAKGRVDDSVLEGFEGW
ncbi:MAG: aspartate aminotransferase family protein [Alphaproteobacteria bacterium]